MPIDPAIAARFAPYLMPNETLLWTGHPPRGLKIMQNDLNPALYSGVFFGTVLFHLVLKPFDVDGLSYAIDSIPSLLGVLFSAFLANVFQAKKIRTHTAYAVSTHHVMFLFGEKRPNYILIPRPLLGSILVEEKENWTGSLCFLAHHIPQGVLVGFRWGQPVTLAFEQINDPLAVLELLTTIPVSTSLQANSSV